MLKEYEHPLTKPIDSDKNIFSLLDTRATERPDDDLIGYKGDDGQWAYFKADQFRSMVIMIAKGLLAKGIKKGDSIAILARTRWEWTCLDNAILSIGAVVVPIYETDSPAQIKHIVNDSAVKFLIAENDEQLHKIDSIADECPTLEETFVMDSDGGSDSVIDIFNEFGHNKTDADFWEAEKAVRGSDLASIVYTSGSTGVPKGIELTHSNFVFVALSGDQTMPDIGHVPGGSRLLLFLPLTHVFARYMQFFSFCSPMTLGLSHNFKTVITDFRDFQPTFILSVPRIFEKVYNAASQRAGRGIKGKVFRNSVKLARQWSYAQQEGKKLPLPERIMYSIYNNLVYKQILEVFGGRVRNAVSGGAPLDADITHFFNGIGMPILEGYGMTETCAPVSVNPTEGYKIGTVGPTLEGIDVGITEEGEICLKGPNICRAYHNNPELTKQQIIDGWLHTGDLGQVDDDGFITITGRKKDMIITAGGKNVSPEILEAAVMSSPVVDHCVLVGDKKPFVSALITLNLVDANQWLKGQGAAPETSLEEAVANPIIRAEVKRVVDKANAQVSRAESIRKYLILPDTISQENGMLTASLKIRRKAITDHYQHLIDTEIYGPRTGKKKTKR
ncbi:long-chain-fatty-acid--CoA ligase [Scardovia inopinata]|uniref:Acyl-CoA synthetase n=1 Tax=Scardovia inopinata F0304 TaxID=641146 RepID=W5IJX4_SCAIO|nr:AMP-dependent synthetase/ligase [Scardovia inopinata]EFG27179.1 hypothetical protein HMPREF9020_00818 [Scardovia inopinata F0304]BAR06790.1 putative long-chain-fatty-acid--CoA ligase [Scardovia inopinata JCM 12537]SUV50853.1 long-chain-fatty-acid--CoA ligase [Scardovia inopinata]